MRRFFHFTDISPTISWSLLGFHKYQSVPRIVYNLWLSIDLWISFLTLTCKHIKPQQQTPAYSAQCSFNFSLFLSLKKKINFYPHSSDERGHRRAQNPVLVLLVRDHNLELTFWLKYISPVLSCYHLFLTQSMVQCLPQTLIKDGWA